jgi:hypothetical protein
LKRSIDQPRQAVPNHDKTLALRGFYHFCPAAGFCERISATNAIIIVPLQRAGIPDVRSRAIVPVRIDLRDWVRTGLKVRPGQPDQSNHKMYVSFDWLEVGRGLWPFVIA